jgi:hypothetical protein
MDDDGFTAGFFFKVAAICLVCGVAAIILLMIFWRAVYAWGLFGAFIALGIVLVLFGWIHDRRAERARA